MITLPTVSLLLSSNSLHLEIAAMNNNASWPSLSETGSSCSKGVFASHCHQELAHMIIGVFSVLF